ncbi:MAG: phosphoribosylamine--glycine ligase [Clostridia bacterium]|nr:phosphoribosylamine--glycine ligase [Clostridia bacterium]
MDIFVIGGGGREHAIVHALNQSKRVEKVYCAPSNAGINTEAEGVPLAVSDFEGILHFLATHPNIGLTVVAPDNPLADGLVNELEAKGFRAFGPRAEAAIIEASKKFAKQLMKDNHIPTAAYESFTDYGKALAYVESAPYPLVVKADGLAYGKGVVICNHFDEAARALDDIMRRDVFGNRNPCVVIEEFLCGREVSVLAFTDGKTVKTMPSSQDHKRAYDGDKGPNTGGMGAFCPSPYYTKEMDAYAKEAIFLPTVQAMAAMGRKFKGVLYFGLIMCADGLKVLEYNARFGDPETQAVLSLLKTDLLDIFEAVIDERLDEINIEWSNQTAVTVVYASGGYPGSYAKGKAVRIADTGDCFVYHAGTAVKDGNLVTNGGRVLAVTARGNNLSDARTKAYAAIEHVRIEDGFYRKDIGTI